MKFIADLHPLVIHFPLVLFILYFFFESIGFLFKKDFLTKSSVIILLLGIFFSIISVLSGNQAEQMFFIFGVDDLEKYRESIINHSDLATYSLAYFTLFTFLRIYYLLKKKLSSKVMYIIILLSLFGVILIILTGLSGGKLVYELGVGTKLLK
ncbi:MAG: DUF2231 domain-containing protein [Ignavibacteria bacterium]|nr:DUF2231 domain-containing protein [Ignavibacteria bacterium]